MFIVVALINFKRDKWRTCLQGTSTEHFVNGLFVIWNYEQEIVIFWFEMQRNPGANKTFDKGDAL